jgi:hypothetical protein
VIPRALLFFVLVSVAATLAGNAVAQSITVNDKTIERRADHSPDVGLTGINYDDCIADDFFGLKVTPVNITTAPGLKVFAGKEAGCATAAGRMTLGTLCWLSFESATLPTTQFKVPVRDIIPHAGGNSETLTHGTAQDCESGDSSPFSLFFALFDGSSQLAATPPKVDGKYDLKGPNPPVATGIGIGDTRLYPTWDASTDDPHGYRIYCEATTGDACVAPTLTAGQKPPQDLAASGQATQLATEGVVEGLTNHQQYACAIGTVDLLQNVGPVSDVVCGVPQPVIGYFKAYRDAGGQAGGGYCAFGRGGSAKPASLAVLGLTALFLAARRRRARRGEAQ